MRRPLLGRIVHMEATRTRTDIPAADYAAQRAALLTAANRCGQHRPRAVDVCNYCRERPPETGQVVCRRCMDRIAPWEVA